VHAPKAHGGQGGLSLSNGERANDITVPMKGGRGRQWREKEKAMISKSDVLMSLLLTPHPWITTSSLGRRRSSESRDRGGRSITHIHAYYCSNSLTAWPPLFLPRLLPVCAIPSKLSYMSLGEQGLRYPNGHTVHIPSVEHLKRTHVVR